MAKFNLRTVRPSGTSPVRSEEQPSTVTHEGAPGYARDARSELFLLAVANMVGEATYYEGATGRDARFRDLVARVALDDPDWLARFLPWLRNTANLRSAPVVAALEAARAMVAAGMPGSRALVASVLQRADEPGEALAYWFSRYGRALPKPVKRGVADAVVRLYTERSLLRYDTASKGFRFGDVIDLVHPTAGTPEQGHLYAHALDRRHQRDNPIPEPLTMLHANADLRAAAAVDPMALLDAGRLRAAGMTWEDALSLVGGRVDKAQLWEALIPSMGYMACLRNLRNFDQAGVSDSVAATVAARLADPAEVARARQFPMRFLSAHRAVSSSRWAAPLEAALEHSLANVPTLDGRTLILIDSSGSMNSVFSRDGSLRCWDAAVVFGLGVARRCAAPRVISFSDESRRFPLLRDETLLTAVQRWRDTGFNIGRGTMTGTALQKHYAGHDRVLIITDEQVGWDGGPDLLAAVPAQIPVYTWNLVGYRPGHAPSGQANRHTFAGLTDAAFRMVPLIEAGHAAHWPF